MTAQDQLELFTLSQHNEILIFVDTAIVPVRFRRTFDTEQRCVICECAPDFTITIPLESAARSNFFIRLRERSDFAGTDADPLGRQNSIRGCIEEANNGLDDSKAYGAKVAYAAGLEFGFKASALCTRQCAGLPWEVLANQLDSDEALTHLIFLEMAERYMTLLEDAGTIPKRTKPKRHIAEQFQLPLFDTQKDS